MRGHLTLVLAAIGTLAAALPLLGDENPPQGPGPVDIVGRACTGSSLTENCTQLEMTNPNTCKESITGELKLDKSISSIEITRQVPCAFFRDQVCVNPKGIYSLVAMGPINIRSLPRLMENGIRAYICGPDSTAFVGNKTLDPGEYIVTGMRTKYLVPVDIPVGKRDGDVVGIDGGVDTTDYNPILDGRGATVYKSEYGNGQNPGDVLAIPGNAYCQDMANFFGNWDDAIKSLVVEPGFRCKFYVDNHCNDKMILVGNKSHPVAYYYLGVEFERKISSVFCERM
ncbi:hypothetical protein GQ43DRAFT_467872 [Delitschia confertaspora ATCC 74209]|uniref:Uncharacterized protein n=1 Tax=Delitschia confertaspora ATCC 74209 TaxID=1513339 RepID=A0A9P4JWM8_9PLEO|nr:hypothetical protein GQ43DRAFT_467872 [Delitschia confertaspora ATCC 74209]